MKLFLMLTASLFVVFNLSAQTFTSYTTDDGLLDNFVECVDIDVDDNVWFGTSIGLQKFDGENWTTYSTATYPDMVSNNIKVVRAMANGDIWIGSDYGVSKFDGVNWITFDNTNGLNNNQVKGIDEDSDGVVYVGTISGVSYFDGDIWESLESSDLHWSGVNTTVSESSGNKWFAAPLGGVTYFDGTSFEVFNTENGLLSDNITDVIIDDYGNKWIGTGAGISVLDASNTSVINHTIMYQMPPPDTLNPIVDLAMDSFGRIWAGIYVGYLSEGGVAMWDGLQWIDYDVSDGIVGPNVKGIEVNSQDHVWVATSTGVTKIHEIPESVEVLENNEIKLYPNPCVGSVKLDMGVPDLKFLIRTFNNQGQLIQEDSFENQQYVDFNIQGGAGNYFIEISSSKLSSPAVVIPLIKL